MIESLTPPGLAIHPEAVSAVSPGEWGALLDWSALAIVLGGTVFATLARCGWPDLKLALGHARKLRQQGFDAEANRIAMALWAHAVRRAGVLGADEVMPTDPDLACALKALVRTGSLDAMRRAHGEAVAGRREESRRAARIFEQAGELAPVFGMVGTLFSMTQIAPIIAAQEASALAAVGTAVLSSLYGVLSAHILFLPIASRIIRRAETIEAHSTSQINWLIAQLDGTIPGARPDREAQVARLHPAA